MQRIQFVIAIGPNCAPYYIFENEYIFQTLFNGYVFYYFHFQLAGTFDCRSFDLTIMDFKENGPGNGNLDNVNGNGNCQPLSNCQSSEPKTPSKDDLKSKSIFSSSPDLEEIRRLQEKFCLDRNWSQYHTPRNLLLALVGEVGELSELFQWRGEVKPGCPDWTAEVKVHLSEEMADVLIYLVRLADVCAIDLPSAVKRKIKLNSVKYPVEKSFGSNKKYTAYAKNNSTTNDFEEKLTSVSTNLTKGE